MKSVMYFLLLIVAIGLSACYPSDLEHFPLVGEWESMDGSVFKITNEYIFENGKTCPIYRYTAEHDTLYLEAVKNPDFHRECPYTYRADVLYIIGFLPDMMFEGYVNVVLTRIKK